MSRLYFDSKVEQGTAKLTAYDDLKASLYLYTGKDNRPCAAGFSGKRSKPDFRYLFNSPEQRLNHITKWLEGLRFRKADKDKEQAERKAFKHDLVHGDILNTSWGYDQTNVEFYQVTKVLTDKSVEIREIAQDSVQTEGYSSMSSHVTPRKNDFIGEAMKKQVTKWGIKINSSATAHKWSGNPCYCSWYG